MLSVAKRSVMRMTRTMGLAGARRGKTMVTAVGNSKAFCPLDKVDREFRVSRPNVLWLVDYAYAHTRPGFLYIAQVVDALVPMIHANRPGAETGPGPP